MNQHFEPFKLAALERLSKIIGDAFSGTQLTDLFRKAGIDGIAHDGSTKWRFLYQVFEELQKKQGRQTILKFLETACDPQEYFGRQDVHMQILKQVNEVLDFYGMKIDGKGNVTIEGKKRENGLDEMPREMKGEMSNKPRVMIDIPFPRKIFDDIKSGKKVDFQEIVKTGIVVAYITLHKDESEKIIRQAKTWVAQINQQIAIGIDLDKEKQKFERFVEICRGNERIDLLGLAELFSNVCLLSYHFSKSKKDNILLSIRTAEISTESVVVYYIALSSHPDLVEEPRLEKYISDFRYMFLKNYEKMKPELVTKEKNDEASITYSDKITDLIFLIQNNLRKLIRNKPKSEKEIQDAIENLLIGTKYETLFVREKISIPFSSKHYFPDFTSESLDTIIEAKFCDSPEDEKKIIAEINDDIVAYKTKFNNLIFVVYDLGFIRDIDQFKKPFETMKMVTVLVVKQ